MSRNNQNYDGQRNFAAGVAQEPENAPRNSVLDARNVWMQNGALTKRPGARNADYVITPGFLVGSSAGGVVIFKGDGYESSGVLGGYDLETEGTTAFTDLVRGDVVYLGLTNEPTGEIWGFIESSQSAASASYFRAEYWNGTEWRDIQYTPFRGAFLSARSTIPYLLSRDAFAVGTHYLSLGYVPTDWAQLTISANSIDLGAPTDYTRYFLRLTIWGEDVDVTLTGGITSNVINDTNESIIVGGGIVRLDAQKSVFLALNNGSLYASSGQWPIDFTGASYYQLASNSALAQPATFATVPRFSTAYAAYNHQVYILEDNGSVDPALAQVNDQVEVVGDEPDEQEIDAIYDSDTVIQLDKFPEANYIKFFNGRLWAAGIKGKPFEIRWSGSELDGAYNVWPFVSFEEIAQDDNTPITGLATLNEHLIVFKEQSIWQMVSTGVNNLGLATYRPIKVASGIGTVSQASIVEVNGRLIFLSEDGFYAFDGTPRVVKLSDLVDEQVARIVPNRKPFATAIHWRSMNVYMCAVSVDGSSENNFVFVYDYGSGAFVPQRGGWWFWDGLSVQSWLREDGQDRQENILFGDTRGRIFELTDRARSDAGKPIDWYVLGHRWGYGSVVTQRARHLLIYGNNANENVNAQVRRHDNVYPDYEKVFVDPAEAQWGTAVWGTDSWVPRKRRKIRHTFKRTGEWMQYYLSGSGTGYLEIQAVLMGSRPIGVR